MHRALPDSDLDIMVECNEDMNYLQVVEKVVFIAYLNCRVCATVPLLLVSW